MKHLTRREAIDLAITIVLATFIAGPVFFFTFGSFIASFFAPPRF